MPKFKSVESSIRVIGNSKLKVVTSSAPPPLPEDQLYTISNEPIVTINGEKIVPIEP